MTTNLKSEISSNETRNIMETSLTHLIFHISTFWKSKFPEFLTLSDIKNVERMLSVFQNLVGPKQLASPSVFKELFGGGILIFLEIWKSRQIIKRKYIILNQKYIQKSADTFWLILTGVGSLYVWTINILWVFQISHRVHSFRSWRTWPWLPKPIFNFGNTKWLQIVCLRICWKSCIWDQHLLKTWNGNLGLNMGSIS